MYISCSMVGTAKGWEGRDTWWRWRCRWGVGCGKHQLFVAVGDVLDDARLVEVEQLRVVRAVSGRVARVHLRRVELHLRPATHRPHHAACTQVGGGRRPVISGDHHRPDVGVVRPTDRVGYPYLRLLFRRRHRCSLAAAKLVHAALRVLCPESVAHAGGKNTDGAKPNRESSMRKRRAWRSRRRARAGAGAGAARRSAPLPHHDLRHVSTLAPELGVHVVLTHLVGTRLATPAVAIRAAVGGDRGWRTGVATEFGDTELILRGAATGLTSRLHPAILYSSQAVSSHSC